MRDWLFLQWDWLLSSIFIAVSTSTIIGFKDGTKGGAIAVSNFASAIVAIVLFPFLEKYGYGGPFSLLLGLFCGACGMATFSVLVSLSNMIERRRAKLAGVLLDRVAPGTGDDK